MLILSIVYFLGVYTINALHFYFAQVAVGLLVAYFLGELEGNE